MTSFNPPVVEFITPSEKKEWFEKQHQFMIMSVNENQGQYGAGYSYRIRRTDKSGEERLITLSANPRRTEEAAWLKKALLEDTNGIGPCVLGQVDTDKGNPAWVFESAD